MRGRKPLPSAVKLLRGNPGKRPLNTQEPVSPAVDLAAPPTFLEGAALVEWHRLGRQLLARGTLTTADIPAFASYCVAWARWLKAEAQLDQQGEIVPRGTGALMVNPWRTIAHQAHRQLQDFWSEFGMTPSSRSRIIATPTIPDDDPLSRFLHKGRQR